VVASVVFDALVSLEAWDPLLLEWLGMYAIKAYAVVVKIGFLAQVLHREYVEKLFVLVLCARPCFCEGARGIFAVHERAHRRFED